MVPCTRIVLEWSWMEEQQFAPFVWILRKMVDLIFIKRKNKKIDQVSELKLLYLSGMLRIRH